MQKSTEKTNYNFLHHRGDLHITDEVYCRMCGLDESLAYTPKVNKVYVDSIWGTQDHRNLKRSFARVGRLDDLWNEAPEEPTEIKAQQTPPTPTGGRPKSVYEFWTHNPTADLVKVIGTAEFLANMIGCTPAAVRKAYSDRAVLYGNDQMVYLAKPRAFE